MKSIRQSDLVAPWIKTALEHEEVDKKSIREEDTVTVPDPGSPDNELRALTAYLYVNEASDEAARNTDYVVGAYWRDMSDMSDVFSEKYSSEQDAQMAYGKLKEQLHGIYRALTVSKGKAEEMATSFFQEIAPSNAGPSLDLKNLSKLHQEILPGWQIVNREGTLLVTFDDEFLRTAFRKFKTTDEIPTSVPEVVYSTASKTHCGADNFVVSFWGKTETAEGNILRNVVRVERFSSGKFHTLVGVVHNDLDIICSSLTPHQMEYGIGFDSITQQWHKTAKAVLQNIFFDSTDDLMKYQREQKGGKGELLPLLDDEDVKKPKDLPELKEEPESISFDELMEKTTPIEQAEKVPEISGPIPGGGPAPGMLASKKPSLKKEAALDAKTLKPGQQVVYVSEDLGQPMQGEVQSVKVNEAGQAEVVLKTLKGKEHIAVEEEDVSYFLDLGEYRGLRHQQTEEQKLEHEKEEEHGPEYGSEQDPHTPQKSEEEKEEEEAHVAPSDLSGEEITEKFVDQILSVKEFNLLKVAALKQWIDWPKGLPRPWMQQLYQKLTTNVRNELRETIHELDAKRKQNDRYYNRVMSLRTAVTELNKKYEDELSQAEKETDPATKATIMGRAKKVKQQKHNRERDLEKARKRFRKEIIQPEPFKQALMQMFMSYAHMAGEFDPRLMKEEEDPQAVAGTSKKIRETLKKLKQVNTQIDQEGSNLEGMVEGLNKKEEELWSHFKSMPETGSPALAALSEKLLQTDRAFSDYLAQAGSNMTEETVNKFQDAIEKLEKQRMGVLPEGEQSEVNTLIKEVHSIEDQIRGSDTLKKIRQLEDMRDKLEGEKASLGEEIGLIAFLKEYKEAGLIKAVKIRAAVEHEIEVSRTDENDDEERFRITYTIEAGSPASMTGHPDTWTPAEGDEIDIINVVKLQNDQEIPVEDDDNLHDSLLEDFSNKMIQHALEVSRPEY